MQKCMCIFDVQFITKLENMGVNVNAIYIKCFRRISSKHIDSDTCLCEGLDWLNNKTWLNIVIVFNKAFVLIQIKNKHFFFWFSMSSVLSILRTKVLGLRFLGDRSWAHLFKITWMSIFNYSCHNQKRQLRQSGKFSSHDVFYMFYRI